MPGTGGAGDGQIMDRRKSRDAVSALALVLFFSFIFNYMWESVHEAFLYKVFKCMADKYILMILIASLYDAFIIGGIYLGIAALWKDLLWLKKMTGSQVLAACLACLAIAALIEYWFALVTEEWSYTPLMPTVFGIGVSPLIQLSATGLLTFWLARRVLYGRGGC